MARACQKISTVGHDWVIRNEAVCLWPFILNTAWHQLDSQPGAIKVKHNSERSVWRLLLSETPVYAKVFPQARKAVESLKRMMLGSYAQREWHACIKAENVSIPVVPTLALGISRTADAPDVLIYQTFDHSRTLRDAWLAANAEADARLSAHKRRCLLAHAAARLLAVSHRSGFLHRDPHPDNILAWPVFALSPLATDKETIRAPIEIQCEWLDVHGGKLVRAPVSARAQAESLAQLHQAFTLSASKMDKLRFLKSYYRQMASTSWDREPVELNSVNLFDNKELRVFFHRLEAAVEKHRDGLARRRDARLQKSNDYYRRLRLAGGWCGTVMLRYSGRQIREIPDFTPPDDATIRKLITEAETRVRDSQTVQAERSFGFSHFHVEMFVAGGGWERAVWGVGGSPAQKRFYASHRAWHRSGTAAMPAVGFVARRCLGLCDLAILIHAGPPDSQRDGG